jgi:hypothetical protein
MHNRLLSCFENVSRDGHREYVALTDAAKKSALNGININ